MNDPLQKNKPRQRYTETPAGPPGGTKRLPAEKKRIQTYVSIQRALLEAVDAAAQEHGHTRSTEIQLLVTEAIEARVAAENPGPNMTRGGEIDRRVYIDKRIVAFIKATKAVLPLLDTLKAGYGDDRMQDGN